MEMLFAKTFLSLGVEMLLFSIEEGLYIVQTRLSWCLVGLLTLFFYLLPIALHISKSPHI
jgi:hypothetical protein